MVDSKEQDQAPKEDADLQERIDSFNKELSPLLGKYELGLAAIPKIVEGGRVVADPVVVSVRKTPQTKATVLDNPDA